MCKKHNPRVIDKCMRNFIQLLKFYTKDSGVDIMACCCGHKKYPMTILIRGRHFGTHFTKKNIIQDIVSGKLIPRKRKFYKKDKQGYYYIPEVVNENH